MMALMIKDVTLIYEVQPDVMAHSQTSTEHVGKDDMRFAPAKLQTRTQKEQCTRERMCACVRVRACVCVRVRACVIERTHVQRGKRWPRWE